MSAATLAFGDNQAERMGRTSQQFAALIDLAKDQAIFNSQELGVLFTENSYAFYTLTSKIDKKKPRKINLGSLRARQNLNETIFTRRFSV